MYNGIVVTQKGGWICHHVQEDLPQTPKRTAQESGCPMNVRLLEICCQKTGLSKTDVIRQGIREVYERVKEK